MTEIITTAPIAARRVDVSRPRIQWRAIGAAITAMPAALGSAFAMVYADPYATAHHRQQIVPDDKLEGRDPNW